MMTEMEVSLDEYLGWYKSWAGVRLGDNELEVMRRRQKMGAKLADDMVGVERKRWGQMCPWYGRVMCTAWG